MDPILGASNREVAFDPRLATWCFAHVIARWMWASRSAGSAESVPNGHNSRPNKFPCWSSSLARSRLRTVTGQMATSDLCGSSSCAVSHSRNTPATTAVTTSLPLTPAAFCTARMRDFGQLAPAKACSRPSRPLNLV